jgi:hypothetical protein
MPRIRSVHPSICEDDTLAAVSASAERTFVRLWTHLDDEGRAIDSPKLWKARLYPLHDEITAELVDADLLELEAVGLVIRYQVDGKRYISAKPHAWSQWQHPQRATKSKLPAPSTSPPRVIVEASVTTHLRSGGERSVTVEEGESEGEGRAIRVIPNRALEIATKHANGLS